MFVRNPWDYTVYYHSDKPKDRSLVEQAEKVLGHIRKIDVKYQKMANNKLKEIADRLELPINRLLDLNSGMLYDSPANNDINSFDCAKMLRHNPELLQTPILLAPHFNGVLTNAEDLLAITKEEENARVWS